MGEQIFQSGIFPAVHSSGVDFCQYIPEYACYRRALGFALALPVRNALSASFISTGDRYKYHCIFYDMDGIDVYKRQIYGGSLGGTLAAYSAAKTGRRTFLFAESDWIGGQLTVQAVPPDEHKFIEETG